MTIRFAIPLILVAGTLAGCDDSVALKYSTKAKAEAESPFANGWLPEIIPPSSRSISMKNDLDLNISNGVFRFDPSDHDNFIRQLDRIKTEDKNGFAAYSYEHWIFWISDSNDRCLFSMRLNCGEKQGERVGAPGR